MKAIKLKIFEFKNLQYMLNQTYHVNTELARVMFKELRDQEVGFLSAEQRIQGKYEEEVMEEVVDKPNVDDPSKSIMKKVPIKQVPYEKQEELDKEMNDFEMDFVVSPLTLPAWKKVILDFPQNVKGLRGEQMIEAYENLKEKFNS